MRTLGRNAIAPRWTAGIYVPYLAGLCPEGEDPWGYTLKRATLGEDRSPVLEFTNGLRLFGFKLVVGTDGAWSKVRSLV